MLALGNVLVRRIGATLVAILLLVYVAYQVYLSKYTGIVTETAMYSTVSESIDTTGFIVRNERVITAKVNGVLNYTVDDGERTAAGGVIADIYPTEENAAARNRIDRIDDELARLSVLENPSDVTTSNPKLIGGQISEKVTTILSCIRKGNISDVEAEKNNLQLLLGQKQIITGAESAEDYLVHTNALTAERNSLLSSSAGSTGSITSPASGFFIRSVDGYENAVDVEEIEKLTAADIRELIDGEPEKQTGENVLGKVAMDFNWYVVCNIDENDYVRLDRTTKVTIEMPFASVEEIPAEIIDVDRDSESGGAALILKCSYMNSDLAAARKEPLRINISKYSGVLIDESAIHFSDVITTETDEDGNETETVHYDVKGVYVKYGSRLKFVQVFTDATINGYAICKTKLSDEEREQLVTSRTVQMYDEVVVEGTDLYNGKIL